MTEGFPSPEEHDSAAAYRYALVMAGYSEEQADKLTQKAWERFQRQVRESSKAN